MKRVEGRSETTVRAVESVLALESGSVMLGRQRGSLVERGSQGHEVTKLHLTGAPH